MAFERFTAKSYRTGKIGEPMISIYKNGQITFSVDAMRHFEIKDFDFAVLFYDADSKSIGIMLTDNGEEVGAYKLIKRKSQGYGISAKKFLNFHDIDFSSARSYPLKYNEDDGLYIFEVG